MKKWFTAIGLSSFLITANAQNDAAMAPPLGTIIAPVTGCALTANEVVTIRIYNAGPGTISAPFDVSFNITGPINSSATETVMVGSIPQNSTLTYTFTATADLSTSGSYSMDATVTVAGDPIATNNSYTGYSITNNAASSVGGITGSTTVCSGSNTGNLTLTGVVGTVLNWEYSTDAGVTWVNISNTTTSQSYDDLTVETWYRANVKNATCATVTSPVGIIQISPVSVGGSTSGGTTPACATSNSGTINLTGKVGNVLNWQFSIDGGVTWTNIANTTTSNAYTNLTTTTRFRAVVQSGVCPSAFSSQRTITIDAATVPGTVTADATVCSGSNSGSVVLGGNTGAVVNWQQSTNGGVTYTDITNTTTTQNYSNISTSTLYRARVKNGVCTSGFSAPATITVVANSDGGTLSSNMTVCNGANDDTLALTGYVGSIVDWEESTDGGLTFSLVGNTNDSLFLNNLTTETIYRVIVQAGSCATDNSNPITVSIDQPSVGGTLTGNAVVCASGNTGNIDLIGQTGSPTNWESSSDNGLTWSTIPLTTTSITYTNLIDTTLYRALVSNGTCTFAYSDTVTITVDPVTMGGTINSNATVCESNNSGTLSLTGNTGTVNNWESSLDGGFTWVSIANTTTSQPYLNIPQNTLYRAVVQSGICPSAVSSIVTLTVDPVADAGNILGATTVCEGANTGSLTLVGTSGSVLDWETSTDGGVTWTPVGNTTVIESFNNLTATTDYRAIATSGVCPNDTSATATISVDALTVGGTVSSDAIVCEISNAGILTLAGETGSVLNWEMSNDGGSTWITLSNSTNFQNYLDLNNTTSYRASVKNGVCPAQSSVPATISVSPKSEGGAVSNSATVCEGLNFGIMTLTGHEGLIIDWESSSDLGATWTSLSNTSINQSYSNLSDTTWYRAIVQNGICPNDTSSMAFINMYPAPNADFLQDTICSGVELDFMNLTTNPVGFVTLYSWDFGDGNTSTSTNPSYTYNTPGAYDVKLFVLNNFGCSDTVTHTMQIDASPVVDVIAGGSTSFCEGGSVLLGTALDPDYTYLWITGETTNTITVDSTHNYGVAVISTSTGCIAFDSLEVTVFPLPAVDAGLDTSVSLGLSTVLNGTGGLTYLWSPTTGLDNPFIANPSASPSATTTYTLTATDNNGCTNSDSVVVTVTGDVVITIYTIITPNGDGFNDTWIIDNLISYPNNSIAIYNRYGQVVYETTNYANDWDGTREGDQLPEGAYFYVVELTDSGEVFKGTVNIVRSSN